MNDKFTALLSACADVDFGAVILSDAEKKFCREWNHESILFCKSLPESTQTEALLFFLKYAKTSFEKLNLFRLYYVPAWSIIYWLIQSDPDGSRIKPADIKHAKAAHFMAMFLHALDDHLTDNQVPATHLTLLLRSQAWMLMIDAMGRLADGVDGGAKIVENFIDDYYASIRGSEKVESLDRYCERFRRQMATWLIVPVLITKKMRAGAEFTQAVRTAYGSFGIAWRLLDDINDIESDMISGVHSAIYVCLSKDTQSCWDKYRRANPRNEIGLRGKTIVDYILRHRIIERITARICSELASAAAMADNHHLPGLANEFRCLLRPLENTQVYP
jgi:hypothetical protein